MKAVLISIQPKWCELIASGKKTIEVRKTRPKLETPFKVYIYCTKNTFDIRYSDSAKDWKKNACGKVIGEFVCDRFYDIIQFGFGAKVFTDNLETELEPSEFIKMSCLNEEQIFEYIGNKDGYGWRISDLVIYDKPRELGEFKKHNRTCYYDHLGLAIPKCKDCKDCQIKRPPQSWCYVESEVNP